MTSIDIYNKEWSQKATEKEMELGGIRIGPLRPPGVPTVGGEPDDEEALKHEEELLRQKLTQQSAQMKEREANGKEYLRMHGIVSVLEMPDSVGVYARH